jgi:mercuric ion binding protein
MKTIKLFAAIVMLVSFSGALSAQNAVKNPGQLKTETIKVFGNCDMCKDRIEKAAKDEGAATATWDSKTKMLTVSFDASKTSTDALSKKIASVGHDTEKFKASDDVYAKLPGCCHYERAK